MQLEDYFEFEKLETKFGEAEKIRIKGHRIAIEFVIEQFNQGVPSEAIVRDVYPTLTLEEVFATLTYYLHNKADIDAYMERGEKIAEAYYQEYLQREPDAVLLRLRALKAQRDANARTADDDPTIPVR